MCLAQGHKAVTPARLEPAAILRISAARVYTCTPKDFIIAKGRSLTIRWCQERRAFNKVVYYETPLSLPFHVGGRAGVAAVLK